MYRELFLILLLSAPLSLASANSLDSVEFDEVPSAWETGDSLEFSVEASGTSIDRILFQSRHPGEILFDTREQYFCQNQASCNWNLEHTEISEGTWEYRFRAYAGDERENSYNYRQVKYINNLEYGVSWTQRPPEGSQRGETVEMSVTASDDASRFESEGVLKLQFLNNDGNWETFDSTDCSRTSSDSSCSNSASAEINDKRIQSGEVDFRGLVEFEGGVKASSDTSTVNVESPQNVDRVVIRNLPSSHPERTGLDLYGEASGSNLEELILRWRPLDGIKWNLINSTDCNGDYCDISEKNYEHPRAQNVEIQALGRAGGSERKDTEVIEFTKKDDGEVDDVNLDSLPDRYKLKNDLEITGSADGRDLDRIILQRREPEDDWESVETQGCNDVDSCNFDYEYNPESTNAVDFRLRAEAGGDSGESNTETVDFYDADSIDDVNIENLPSEWGVDKELEIEASAEGDDLDDLVVQESDRDRRDWAQVEDYDCGGDDNCDFTADYTAENEEEKDFRVKAVAEDGNHVYSDKEEVNFVENPDTIDSVSIDDLPSEYSLNKDLEIKGDARGEDLNRLELQERDQNEDGWNILNEKDCNSDDSCSISVSYSTDNEEDKEFRIKAFVDGYNQASDIQEVSFAEDPDTVDSVSIDDLPSTHPLGDSLDIYGEASGQNLIRLEAQKKEGGDWSKISDKDCYNDNSCSIDASYTTDTEEEIKFRIKAFTQDNSETSNIEEVQFQEEFNAVGSVNLYDLPARHPVGDELEIEGDASGNGLTEIAVEKKEGGNWEDLKTKDCEGRSDCDVKAVFEASREKDVSFRIRAETDDDTARTDSRKITFYRPKSVDSVIINNLPSNYEEGQSLRIDGGASGRNLDNIEILTRNIDDISWNMVFSKSCKGDSCSIQTDYSSSKPGRREFVVRSSSGGRYKFSGIQVVDFREVQQPEVSSVSIDSLPDSYSLDENLEIGGEALGIHLGEIKIQYRNNDDWKDIGIESCSGSSCSISKLYSTGDDKNVDFRIKAFAGDDEATSRIETVSFEGSSASTVDTVGISDLSPTHPVDDSLDISGEASGENLESIRVQHRGSGGDWSTLHQRDCSGSSCSIDADYTADGEEEKDFRIRASSEDDSGISSVETVNFVEVSNQVTSVEMLDLPARHPVGDELEIRGEASGRNLDQIKILTRDIDDISWETVASKRCTGGSCSIQGSYSADNPERREFVVRASAGGDDKFSGIQVVDFREVQQPEVSSVSIESLPSTHPLEQGLEVSGEASGTQLDEIKIQYREDGSWKDLATESCSGSSCSISSNYDTDQEMEVDFRVEASAGDDEKFSGMETVSFEESPAPAVDSVTIDNLPSQHPVDEDLEVSGEASGTQLDSIKVQKNYDNSWEDIEEESCSGASCSIDVDVSEASEKTVDYRVRASAGQSSEVSDTETVEFVEEQEPADPADPAVKTVTLEEISSTYKTDKTLEIEVEASGVDLESLRVLKRPISGISWDEVDSTSCSGSPCTLETEYLASSERTMEFVAEASVGDINKRSNREVVKFRDEDDTDDEDDEDNDNEGEAELDVEVEDRDDNELEDVRVEAMNGEDKVRYTNSQGRTSFDLEPGDYEVEASKDGYRTETRDIDLDEGEEEEVRFRLREGGFGIRVSSIDSEASVCEGQNLEVTAVLSNIRESDQTVAVYVEGLGESNTETVTIEGEDVQEAELLVESVEGLGDKEFTVVAENDGRSSKDKEIEVEDCDPDEDVSSNTPTGISASVTPRTVLAGETIKVTGDIQNVRSSRNVEVFGVNRRVTVSSSRDGRYQAFVTLNAVGTRELNVRADGVSATRTVEVLPNAHVNPMKAPSTAVQGEQFEICAEVQSEVSPRVVLERDGKVIESVNDKGEVCFSETASESGEKLYTVRASTSGAGSSVSKRIRILEDDNQVESFLGAVTSIETEAGLAKVSLYNRGSEVSTYGLELEGLYSGDVSQTSQQELLAPGERETVYFYFSPSTAGTSTATIDVTRDGDILETHSIKVRTVEKPERQKSFFQRFNPF